MNHKPLPIEIDDFKEMITDGYYYVDKTLFIKELLDKKGEANLFTRPRSFGKTLNLSMLRYFFEDTGNEKLNAENHGLFSATEIVNAGKVSVYKGNEPVSCDNAFTKICKAAYLGAFISYAAGADCRRI